MIFPKWLKVYGDKKFRGECPREVVEQITFFSWLRKHHPELSMVTSHQRNEGKRTRQQTIKQKAEGMAVGAADIIIPASISFVCELKRKDHTKSKWQTDQKEYLKQVQSLGAFACVALGYEGAKEALGEWIIIKTTKDG